MNKVRAISALAVLAFFAFTIPAQAVTLVQQPDSSADLIGTEVLLQAGLDRQTTAQNGLASLVAECILHTPVGTSAQPLEDAVEAGGGSISYTVEARDVRFYLEGLTGSYGALLDLLRSALTKPDFGAKTMGAAQAALEAKIAQNQRLALNVGIEMLNRQFYRSSSAGMPPDGLPETLASFAPSDAQAFYAAHYRSNDAIVSVVGDVRAVPDSAYGALVSGLPSSVSHPVAGVNPQLPSSSHQLIAHRDVPVPWLVAQYPAPDIRSRDFGAMLVLTAFMQRTLADVSGVPAIATQPAAQRGVGAFYNFDTRPANVIIYVDGGLGDPTRTFATALTIVNVLGHAKLAGDLSEMKSFAAGRFLEDTTTLQDRAWLGGVFAARQVTGDYHERIVRAINATTADDLQRVASRYLSAPTIALVLPREVQAGTPATP